VVVRWATWVAWLAFSRYRATTATKDRAVSHADQGRQRRAAQRTAPAAKRAPQASDARRSSRTASGRAERTDAGPVRSPRGWVPPGCVRKYAARGAAQRSRAHRVS
jgi:hypothetical protein